MEAVDRAGIKILLVEDEPLWQQGITNLVEMERGWRMTGIAADYDAAIDSFEAERPDVVLLDWKIKGSKDGLAVGAAFLELGFPAERVILVSGSERSLIPENSYQYVPKHLIPIQLIETIKRVTKH